MNEELFDADMLSLDEGHLQSIIENAPSIITQTRSKK